MDARAVLCLLILPILAQEVPSACFNCTTCCYQDVCETQEKCDAINTPAEEGMSTWLIIGLVALGVLVMLALLPLALKCCKKEHAQDEDSLKEKLVKGTIPKVTHMDPFAA